MCLPQNLSFTTFFSLHMMKYPCIKFNLNTFKRHVVILLIPIFFHKFRKHLMKHDFCLLVKETFILNLLNLFSTNCSLKTIINF